MEAQMQSDIFGGASTPAIHVHSLAKDVMKANPITWKSHRLLMRDIGAKLGIRWDKIPRDQRHILEDLLNLSPDFERAARKIREEESAMQRGSC